MVLLAIQTARDLYLGL